MNSNYFNILSVIAGFFGIKFVAEESGSVIVFGMCLIVIFSIIVVAGYLNQAVRDNKKGKVWRTD